MEATPVPLVALLVAIDMETLYSSIPHEQGIRTAESFLMEEDRHSWSLNRFVLDLLTFILTKKYFIFMDQLFLQIQGVAMGTCCAPSYANLYLGGWE